MNARRVPSEFCTVALILSLPWMAVPLRAAEESATLKGAIVRSDDQSPLSGATLHAGDARTGRVFSSTPATEHGNFVLAELPPATYALAVESAGGLYVVETPVALAPGTSRTLNLAVKAQPMNLEGGNEDDESDDGGWLWDNPLTAALAVAGIAFAVGLLLDDDSSDTRFVSPTTPLPN